MYFYRLHIINTLTIEKVIGVVEIQFPISEKQLTRAAVLWAFWAYYYRMNFLAYAGDFTRKREGRECEFIEEKAYKKRRQALVRRKNSACYFRKNIFYTSRWKIRREKWLILAFSRYLNVPIVEPLAELLNLEDVLHESSIICNDTAHKPASENIRGRFCFCRDRISNY